MDISPMFQLPHVVLKQSGNAKKRLQSGKPTFPVQIEGRKITQTFWGKAWCQHIESFSDYSNRLPRGRTYVRNGSVYHLEIKTGVVEALVMGSSNYRVTINVTKLSQQKWHDLKAACAGKITSLLDLLAGKLSDGVMAHVCDKQQGLFPLPQQINLNCSCPDWAEMCKHVAAVLYGVGSRLDASPEQLFLLRGVDHNELIDTTVVLDTTQAMPTDSQHLSQAAAANIFDIDINTATPSANASEKTTTRNKQRKKSNLPRYFSGEAIRKSA